MYESILNFFAILDPRIFVPLPLPLIPEYTLNISGWRFVLELKVFPVPVSTKCVPPQTFCLNHSSLFLEALYMLQIAFIHAL